jgi:hypothetical protein
MQMKKKFIEAQAEITKFTITSTITTSDDLGNGDNFEF